MYIMVVDATHIANNILDLCLCNTKGKGHTRISDAVALSVPDEGYSRNAPCALNLISTFLLV